MKQDILQKIFRKIEFYCKFIGMKRILILTIFVLVCCFQGVAQDCPTIKVIPPSKLPPENSAMLFSVSISGNIDSSKLEYNWSFLQGNIIDGQGTAAIIVSKKENVWGEINTSIEVNGLPEGCNKTFSEKVIVTEPVKPQCHCLLDEYGKLPWLNERIRLENLIMELVNSQNTKGYLIFTYKDDLEKRAILNRQKKILKYLESRKISSCRILFKVEYRGNYSTKITVVPDGAELPVY